LTEVNFHDLLGKGLLQAAKRRDDYIEVDAERELTPRQIKRMQDHAEGEGLIKALTDKEKREAVNATCILWARAYHRTDRPEIERMTGALKKSSPKAGGIYIEDAQYKYVCGVVNSMSAYSRMFIIRHFITKRPDMSAKEFCRKIDVSYATYKKHLADARSEFLQRGGIQ
jgi:hypothetical protein